MYHSKKINYLTFTENQPIAITCHNTFIAHPDTTKHINYQFSKLS